MTALKNALAGGLSALLLVGAADAQGWGRGEHAREPARGYDRGHYDARGGGYERRGYERGPLLAAPSGPGPVSPRDCGDFVPCRYSRPDHLGYPPGYSPSGARAWRRGQFLPRPYWSGDGVDPRRYRLRSPPPGYGWYGVGRDAYLVQRSTGLILDTAPGAW